MDLAALTESWRTRLERQRDDRRRRAAAARQKARCAADVLRSEFGVQEVWLSGSVVGEPRHDAFDVDLAVRGLPPERYYAALARVSDVVGGPVDLVTLETCTDRMRGTVSARGERLDG